MTLADLLEHLERRRAEAVELGTLVPEEKLLTYVLDQLRTVQVQRAPTPPEEDHLLSAAAVAERMGVSKGYVYAHADRWPFTRRVGEGVVRFSAQGLARWIARGNGDG